jgi:3-methyladenine DNA glycosylase AlkD
MAVSSPELVRFIESEFHALADPAKAAPMQAYMKTAEPFYGIQKPERARVFREMKKRFAPATRREYEASIRALWRLPHREEKYAAIEYAVQSPALITGKSLPLYEKLIREGSWWDLVDPVAVWLVARVLLAERRQTRPIMARWIGDKELWIRRAALLSQIRHKEATDERQLFAHCLRCAPDQAFFIRKAIGWALRDYSYTAPHSVRDFLLAHRGRLSGLSFREGAKQLIRTGLIRV